jgi:hypothetical protein
VLALTTLVTAAYVPALWGVVTRGGSLPATVVDLEVMDCSGSWTPSPATA